MDIRRYEIHGDILFDVYRKLHIKYNGIPVDASVEMPDGIMDLMEPYGYDALLKHDNKFMSGFEAEVYNYTQISYPDVRLKRSTIHPWSGQKVKPADIIRC